MVEDKYNLIIDKLDSLGKGQKDLEKGLSKNDVRLEQISSDIKAVAEGHQVIRSEIRQMEGRLTDKISLVDGRVEHLGREFREMKEDISVLRQDVSTLKRTLDDHVKMPTHA